MPPIFVPAAVFSATDSVVAASEAMTGASFTSVTLIVMSIVSSSVPSETVIVTE